MRDIRPAAVPLLTVDPYFSIWSSADNLYDDFTRHWTGARNSLTGLISVDSKVYRFMGKVQHNCERYYTEPEPLEQTSLEVRPLTTIYTFENELVNLKLEFMTPLLLDEPELLSRPFSYISYEVNCKDGKDHDIKVYFDISAEAAVDHTTQSVVLSNTDYSLSMGTIEQNILGKAGDDTRIDWGYLHMMAPEAISTFTNSHGRKVFVRSQQIESIDLDKEYMVRDDYPLMCAIFNSNTGLLCIGYDDIKSIEYFGEHLGAYWRKDGMSFKDAAKLAIDEYESLKIKVDKFDKSLIEQGEKSGGYKYPQILSLAYRQSIAAHKTVWDGENLLFISKECYSNGCAATVDVTYPSIPLFLIYNPEFVKGMLRPVFRYANTDAWEFDFAPHDVGTYPLLNGQVYGANKLKYQMPVEECGNMLISTAAVCMVEDSPRFALENMELLEKWANYLQQKGFDPEHQLCTDDFAGHLAHNCNLSIKAIMGITSFGIIRNMIEKGTGDKYIENAKEFATKWKEAARDGDHYRLAFDREDTWSLKYNLVWDKLFKTEIFDENIFEDEVKYYLTKFNEYGIPLDNRADYTKLDWMMWATILTNNEEFTEKTMDTILNMINSTADRVPLTDWFNTVTARQIGFQNRSVVGGLFIRLLDI